jgi:hypothetical protein
LGESMTNRRLRRLGLPAALTAGLIAAALVLALGTARSAPARAFAASIDVTQTCTARVKPKSQVDMQAVVANTGDVQLTIAPNPTGISADAGTPLDESDDFSPAYASGDANGNGFLDPGEHWTYAGSFTAGTEDLTDIVDVDALGASGEDVSDLANCDTDVIQTPQPGVIVGVQKVSGKVLVKQPGGKFVPLTGATEIKVGSIVDTTHGMIKLTAGLGGGKTNSANFNDGRFKIQQSRVKNAYMTLVMQGGNFGICRGRTLSAFNVDAKRKRQVRRLWGNGKGRFTTKGRYSSATVRGTHWLVQDRCDGTLTRVLRGVVKVKDFRKHKTVNVRAGRTYLAKAP